MKSTLITNIAELTTNLDEDGGRRQNVSLVIEGEKIVWVGDNKQAPASDRAFDAQGRALLPGWVDSHTHMVFAGDRSAEFEARMAGKEYKAGGINTTVRATRAAADETLEENLLRLIKEARSTGTTTLETKTGYGLTVEDEVRSARIAAKHADSVTFLGAHIVPEGEAATSYLQLVKGQMLDSVETYIDSVDVFCEEGAFDEQDSQAVLNAALSKGIPVRVHGNQLNYGAGVRIAVESGALSVDHLNYLSAQDITLLADSWSAEKQGTVATVLPACDLSTKMPLAPARALLDAGVTVAIASNCNPGTSFTNNMNFCVATAVLQMGLSIEEAVYAATVGGAMALGLHLPGKNRLPVGRIAPGYSADLQLLNANSVAHLAYRPGMHLTTNVWKAGEQLF